jgi:hypothetical protein
VTEAENLIITGLPARAAELGARQNWGPGPEIENIIAKHLDFDKL